MSAKTTNRAEHLAQSLKPDKQLKPHIPPSDEQKLTIPCHNSSSHSLKPRQYQRTRVLRAGLYPNSVLSPATRIFWRYSDDHTWRMAAEMSLEMLGLLVYIPGGYGSQSDFHLLKVSAHGRDTTAPKSASCVVRYPRTGSMMGK